MRNNHPFFFRKFSSILLQKGKVQFFFIVMVCVMCIDKEFFGVTSVRDVALIGLFPTLWYVH
jgi:hypothetical protein